MDTSLIALYAILLVAGWLTGKVLNRFSGKAQGDAVPGMPVLGSAIALGTHGTSFINACRQKFGDVFHIKLVGQRMEFWFDTHLIDEFFGAPDSQITFRPAVEQFTQRVFGLPSKTFFPKHSQILQDLRHLLVPGMLGSHAEKLAVKVQQHLPSVLPVGASKVDLYAAIKHTVFRSALEVLFGNAAPKALVGRSYDELQADFFAFEDGFELAASPVPHLFQPRWVRARKRMLEWLSAAYNTGAFEGTPVGALLDKADLGPKLAPNLALALMWASQANTVPATFWATAMLLLPENSSHLQGVLKELEQEAGPKPSEGALIRAACKLASDRKSLASRCAAEAVRLRVQSIDVRIAATDLEIPVPVAGGEAPPKIVRVPKGRILALCPFISHHDDALYPSAHTFNPDRQGLTIGDGASVVPSVSGLAFGGGPYRCPGRFFAEMEVALISQLVLAQRSFQLLGSSGDTGSKVADSGIDQRQTQSEGPGLWAVLEPQLQAVLGPDVCFWGLGLLPPAPSASALPPGSTSSSSSSTAPGSGTRHATAQAASGDGSRGAGAEADAVPASSTPPLETWRRSGDVSGLLPPCNHLKLVGVKVPQGACWVSVAARS